MMSASTSTPTDPADTSTRPQIFLGGATSRSPTQTARRESLGIPAGRLRFKERGLGFALPLVGALAKGC